MKRILLILAIFFIVLSQSVIAGMVRYIDENGKIHYVNPDFVKVPEKYLPQVQSQLKSQVNQELENNAEIVPPESEQPVFEQNSGEGEDSPDDEADHFDPITVPDEDTIYQYNPDNIDQNQDQDDDSPVSTRVDLFTSRNCPDCDLLERDLIANNIPFKKHDINYSSYGKRIYKNNGSGKLPLVRVGFQTFFTTNINVVKETLYPPKK